MKKHYNPDNTTTRMSRREFLGTGAAAAAAFTVVPRHILGGTGYTAASDQINVAGIGVGGKGRSDVRGADEAGGTIYALCDVDMERAAESINNYPKAKVYVDYREMLEKEPDIDAVIVSTPDHNHAPIAAMAMKMGKHAYVQKPLTRTIHEARELARIAKENKVMTQMGNQGHAGEGARLINEWIWQGAIGDVTEVHTWTNRPVWPQGIEAPTAIPAVPSSMHWDQWIGPAPYRPYHPAYAPFRWRGWWDFGVGALGDMGAHIIDHPYWALKLEQPTSIQATSTPYTKDSYPVATAVTYQFPKRGKMPPVTMKWFDGGLKAPRPDDLEDGRMMGSGGGGIMFYGTKGKLMASVYGNNPRLIPETFMQKVGLPEKTIKRSPGIYQEWIDAIRNGGPEPTSNFSYAAALTETMLLGNLAVQFQEDDTILEWDAKNMRVTNLEKANDYLHYEYRDGYKL